MDNPKTDIKCILLVEDDPRDVELTLTALEEQNLTNQIVVVNDGEKAFDYLYHRGKYAQRAGGDPIVVLLDNKMPKVSGMEMLKTVKGDENLRTTPVVVLTSSRETPDLQEFYRYGVNAYVVKPVGFSEFMQAVEQLGVFWTAVNEPPLFAARKEAGAEHVRGVLVEEIEGTK